MLIRTFWAGRLRIHNNISGIQKIQRYFDQVDPAQGELRISPEAENGNKYEGNRSGFKEAFSGEYRTIH
jgi:hypothetical protein